MNAEPNLPKKTRSTPQNDDKHNLGLGLGIGGGALAGGLIGFAVGPAGAIAGATLGAMTGAVTGLGISKAIDPDGTRDAADKSMDPPELDVLPQRDENID